MRRRDLERGGIVIVSNDENQICAKFLELRYEIAAGRKKRLWQGETQYCSDSGIGVTLQGNCTETP